MADAVNANIGNDLVQQFLQQANAQRDAEQQDFNAESKADDQAQAAIARKLAEKKQAAASKEHSAAEGRQHAAQQAPSMRRWRQLTDGSAGAEFKQFAESPALQQKLSDKLKQLFVASADHDSASTSSVAKTLREAAARPSFAQAAPTAQVVGDLGARLLKEPKLGPQVDSAMAHPFMGAPRGDGEAKQGFLRFASKALSPGVSVTMAGDLLESVRQTREPGRGQRAAIDMLERDPNNVAGARTLDEFVKAPAIGNMASKEALGEAVAVLAKGNGHKDLADVLVGVAASDGFRALAGREKSQTYITVGQGRPSELHGIASQALAALGSGRLLGDRQVGRYLSALSREVQSNDGRAKGDNRPLMRQAKAPGQPRPPRLQSTANLSDEEAELARRGNRSAVTSYYSRIMSQQDGAERDLGRAKSFLEANKITGVRPPDEPDLASLEVRNEVRERVESALAEAKAAPLAGSPSRQLGRVEHIKALSATLQGEQALSTDEATFVLAKTAQAVATARASELGVLKQRRTRQLRGAPEPPRRHLAASRRPQGRQLPYIKLAGRPLLAQVDGGEPQGPAPSTAAAGRRAAAGGSLPSLGRSATSTRQDVRNIMAQLDPKLPRAERAQQAADIIGQQAAARSRTLAAAVFRELMGEATEAAEPAQAGSPTSPMSSAKKPIATGARDAWGIQRSAERDLGAHRDFKAVRPPQPAGSPSASREEAAAEPAPSGARRRQVAKAGTPIRPVAELWQQPFRDMTHAEQAIFRNLGWRAETWENRSSMAPATYQKPYAELSDVQRQSVRLLGLGAVEWDAQAAKLRG